MKKVILIGLVMVLMFTVGCRVGVQNAPEPTEAPVQAEPIIEVVMVTVDEPTPVEPTPEPEEVVEVHTYYDIPLDRELQSFIIDLCYEYGINPTIVLGMIGAESGYICDIMGDGGNSYGLMQIQKRFFGERMERLGVTDLLDPYQNVTVGVDFLAELIAYYDGNVEMALMAYNAGQGGAYEHWFKHHIYSNHYSQKVLSNSEKLQEEAIIEVEG